MPPASPAESAQPAKRKPPSSKPRETGYLDLSAMVDSEPMNGQKRQLDILMKLLRKKKKIVVIAGAGISVGAGIPDFRSSTGLFKTLRTAKVSGKELFDASVYSSSSLTESFHDMVRNLHSMAQGAEPTEFHQLLATLANEGRLLRLYSQNVDCIETRLEPLKTHVPLGPKGPWPRTIQVHGGLEMMNCSKCSYLQPFKPDMFRGPEPPNCPDCKESDSIRSIAGIRSRGIGKLRPRIVLYNEFHPDADAIGAVTEADIKTRPDAVIVVGTSLKVPGVKRIVREMCQSVRDYRGGISVWLNESDPPTGKECSGLFDLVVRGDCEKVAQFAKLPRWDSESESSEESFVELKKDEYPQGTQLEVQIPAHLPSPSLSPVPPVRSVKPRKRATEGDQQDNKPAKKPRVGAKRSKTTATEGAKVANPKKRETKAPSTIKSAFRSAKNASKTKSSTPKGSKRVIPIAVEPVDVLSSSLSPPSSSIPLPPPRSISITSLLN